MSSPLDNSARRQLTAKQSMARFCGFLLFMVLIELYGLVHLVDLYRDHSHQKTSLTVALILSALVLTPAIFIGGNIKKAQFSSGRAKITLGICFVPFLIALLFETESSNSFSNRLWMLVPFYVFLAIFPTGAVRIRIRQKFWRSDWNPNA
jgi:hypothetical protein